MFNNLVTYHVHKHDHLPANDALVYQYILAGNGVFCAGCDTFLYGAAAGDGLHRAGPEAAAPQLPNCMSPGCQHDSWTPS